jgi:benzoyl-CoA reductase/2-hydroxyglutaryl-CoA dehydratase subunit BcrC/BadD/HgdB
VKDVLFTSPFVPREWIAAHGLHPRGMQTAPEAQTSRAFMGVCPFAETFLEAAASTSAAAVFATTCDQMRRAFDHAASRVNGDVFLLNVPAVWQAPGSRQLYQSELHRLGAFLVRLGGSAPSQERLAAEMQRHIHARDALLAYRARLSAREFAEAVSRFLLDGTVFLPARDNIYAPETVPLAIIGETLLPSHFALLDWIETSGCRVALDATSGGERSLLPSFVQSSIHRDPFAALADGYFAGVTDAFQRPNTRLYDWLRARISGRGIRGIILWHYAWCDLWRAEAGRLRDEFHLPVLHLDATDAATPGPSIKNRLEAFFEILRP